MTKNSKNETREKKLIGFMNSYLSSGEGSISGGDMAFIQIVRRLKIPKKIIVTPKSGEKLCISHGLNADFKNTSYENKHGNIPLTWIKRLIRAFLIMPKPLDDDILYGGSDFFVDVIPAFFSKIKNPKCTWVQCIFHIISDPSKREGPYTRNFISFLFQRINFKIISKYADLIIVDSPLIKDQLIKKGMNSNQIYVGYVGTDIDYIKKIKPYKPKEFDAYFMGRFHESKGIYDLVNIWEIVVKHNPTKKLGIIGTSMPEIRLKLEKNIKNKNLEKNIKLLGFLPKEESISRIKSGKIFLFPSHEEGFGIAILESLACGTPVIAWDLEVYQKIFHDSIIKIPKGNFAEFAQSCIKILGDENLVKALKNAGIALSERYDWNKIAESYHNEIIKCINNRKNIQK